MTTQDSHDLSFSLDNPPRDEPGWWQVRWRNGATTWFRVQAEARLFQESAGLPTPIWVPRLPKY